MKRVLGAVLVVAVTVLVPATRGEAQTDGVLGGYSGTGAASALHAFYNPSGVLPVAAPVDLGVPDALATIAGGPDLFARASVADPGDLLANPDALLVVFSAQYPAGTVPPYPYRVTASSGSGAPTAESNPAPGLNARAAVTPDSSTASGTMPGLEAPAIADAGSMTAKATTKTTGDKVTVTSYSQVNGFDLLGLVKIDSIVTDLTATSDGTGTKLSGGTRVTGATIAGQAVTIDGDGVHPKGQATVLAGIGSLLTGNLNTVLARAGIRITLAGPVELEGATSGQRATNGLRIDFEFSSKTQPELIGLLNMLPPVDVPVPGLPVSPSDLIAVAKARHLSSIEIGRGLVSLAARPGYIAPPFVADTDVGGSDLGSDFLPSLDLSPTGPSVVPSLGRTPALATNPVRGLLTGDGVGALVLLALVALPFIGETLTRLAAAVLAPARNQICQEEER